MNFVCGCFALGICGFIVFDDFGCLYFGAFADFLCDSGFVHFDLCGVCNVRDFSSFGIFVLLSFVYCV